MASSGSLPGVKRKMERFPSANIPNYTGESRDALDKSARDILESNKKVSIKDMIKSNRPGCLEELNTIRKEYPFLIEVDEVDETDEVIIDKIINEEFLCPEDDGGSSTGEREGKRMRMRMMVGGGPDIPHEVQQAIAQTDYDKAMVVAGQSGAEPPEPPAQLSKFLAKQEENYGIIVALSKKTGNFIYCSSKEIGNYIKDAVIVGMIVKYNVSLTVAIYYGSIIRFSEYSLLANAALSVIPDMGVVSYITTTSAGLTKLGYEMGAWAAGLVVGPPAAAKGALVVCACILAYLVNRYLRKIQNVELSDEQKQAIQDTIDIRDMNIMVKAVGSKINAELAEKKAKKELQGTMADIEKDLADGNILDALNKYVSNFRESTEGDWPKALLAGKIMIYFDNLIRNMALEEVKNIAGSLQAIFNLLFTKEYDGNPVTLDDRTQLLALEIPNLSAEMLKLSIAPYILMKVGHLGDIELEKVAMRTKTTTNNLMKNLGYGITNFTDIANYLMPRRTIFISNSVWDKLGAMAGMMSSKLSAAKAAAASVAARVRPPIGGSASRRRRKSTRRTSRKPRNKRKTIRKKVSKTRNIRKRTLNKKSKKRSKRLRK